MNNQIILIVIFLIVSGCDLLLGYKEVFKKNPYEKYLNKLEKAGLMNNAFTQLWVQAGKRSLQDSLVVQLPFSESGFFDAKKPLARSYQFIAKEGQQLNVKNEVTANPRGSLFIDLFQWNGKHWENIAYSDSGSTLNYEFRDNAQCLLRLQPEVLTDLHYNIIITMKPSLINPVAGAGNKSIGSLYGASRDGGKRLHQGVDIFAPKGTPVVAPTAGYISKVGTNHLGGKVVWIMDMSRSLTYYFAHLDSQYVRTGKKVNQGDTIGTVGNTGNAKNTPPHLHFGIYQRGSKDPLHFIHTIKDIGPEERFDWELAKKEFKTVKQTALKITPGKNSPSFNILPKNTYLKIIGHAGSHYRIILPDEQQGFLIRNDVLPILKGRKIETKYNDSIWSAPYPSAVPITVLSAGSSFNELAGFNNYNYIEYGPGKKGWIRRL